VSFRSLPLPPFTPSQACLPPIASPDAWSVVDSSEEHLQGGQSKARLRRYSDQDLKTRNARASLLPVAHRHRSASSYPIYSPVSQQLGFSPQPPFLPWGTTSDMEAPRLMARPVSPASSTTSRSSFESRQKSPLSISSSIDYESSRTSIDSSYSNSNVKNEFLSSRSTMAPAPFPHGKRIVSEPLPPMYARYGAGGEGRQQMQPTLQTPLRLRRMPPSPTSFGKKVTLRIPGEGFKKLPEEILLVVLAELKKLHLDETSLSCSTCWMRDLTNLGLICKKWWGAAKSVLYEDIQLTGCDSILHTKKKFKIKYGTRLRLLRQTLRTRPDLAEYVKSLKVPAVPDAAKNKKDQDEYIELVATLIMACPNLERLPSFYPTYNHEFSRFVHALSTRKNLTERVWIIQPSPFQRQHRYNFSDDSEYFTPILAPSPLLPEQCIDFLTYHSNWSNLRTLFLHCNPGGTIDSLLFTDIFHSLPSLENLHVSSFPESSFNDSTLLSLPSLKSLRLEDLPGITSNGLSSYASPTRTDSLTHLSLISVPLVSLPVLARLCSHLKSLTHLTISQPCSPCLPIGVEIWLHPYLASPTLQNLHWEFTNPDDDKATEILAKSMIFGGFPALKTLRAPTDHDGTLQKLCRPRERIELPGDRYRNLGIPTHTGLPHSQSVPNIPSPTRSTFSMGHGPSGSVSSSFIKSPARSTFSLNDKMSHDSDEPGSREKGMSLAIARRMAQQRIDHASTQPKFHIIIWDEDGQFVERYAVGGFMGTIESKVYYSLKPDVDGMDESIVHVEGARGLLDAGEEMNSKDGCTGSWNLEAGVAKGKNGGKGQGKDRWWHSERGRWRELPLEKFF
jgi:hypothetical protein